MSDENKNTENLEDTSESSEITKELFEDEVPSPIFNETETDEEESETSEEDEEAIKNKRKKIIIISALSVVAILLIVYLWGYVYYRSHFLPFTEINGIDVGGKNVQNALETIDRSYHDRKVTLIGEDGLTATIFGSQIDLTFDDEIGDLQELINAQDAFAWQFNIITKKTLDLSTDYKVNEEKLDQVLQQSPIVSSPNIVAPKNASIAYNGSQFVIDPSVDGDQPNLPKLKEAVVKALVLGDSTIGLKKQGLYDMPSVTSDDPTLQSQLEAYNKAAGASITLNFPTRQVVLNKDTFASWLTVQNGQVTVNGDSLNQYVANLAAEYNTAGKDLAFHATNGQTYYFSDNSGWILNQEAERNQLRQQILDGTVVTEDPIWSQRGTSSITGSTISGTYVEVNLDSQQLWFYNNGSMIASSTIVSGCTDQGEATTTGLYFIKSKNTNVNLNVRYPDGSFKNTQVKYWLPYSDHYGIESASWRTDFGGNIYVNQGTDGDVDVPESMGSTLYNNLNVGTPVVIY